MAGWRAPKLRYATILIKTDPMPLSRRTAGLFLSNVLRWRIDFIENLVSITTQSNAVRRMQKSFTMIRIAWNRMELIVEKI